MASGLRLPVLPPACRSSLICCPSSQLTLQPTYLVLSRLQALTWPIPKPVSSRTLRRKPADSLWHSLTMNTSLTYPRSRDTIFALLSCVFSSICTNISQVLVLISLLLYPIKLGAPLGQNFSDSLLSLYHNSIVSDTDVGIHKWMSPPITWEVGEELKELANSKALCAGWLRNNWGQSQKFTDLI